LLAVFAPLLAPADPYLQDLSNRISPPVWLGGTWQHPFGTEVFPNLLDNIVVVGTLEIAHAIVLEAALSFLELGVPTPLPSWCLMIAEGKAHILFDPWLITIPGAMLFLLVLAVNLLGDGLRDATSPKSRN
jgi:peptide/nickel transport system permease protein